MAPDGDQLGTAVHRQACIARRTVDRRLNAADELHYRAAAGRDRQRYHAVDAAPGQIPDRTAEEPAATALRNRPRYRSVDVRGQVRLRAA